MLSLLNHRVNTVHKFSIVLLSVLLQIRDAVFEFGRVTLSCLCLVGNAGLRFYELDTYVC